MNVCPPTVSVPVRPGPAFAETLKATVPFPAPVAPDVIVSHDGLLLVAVQGHPVAAETAIVLPVVADAGTERLVGLIVTEQVVAGAAA